MHLNSADISKLDKGSVELSIGENRYCGELSSLEADENKLVLHFDWVAKALRSVWTKTPLFNLEIDLTRTFIGVYGGGYEFACPSRKAVVRIFPHGAGHVRKEDIVESLYSIAKESIPENIDNFISSVQVPGMVASAIGNANRDNFRR